MENKNKKNNFKFNEDSEHAPETKVDENTEVYGEGNTGKSKKKLVRVLNDLSHSMTSQVVPDQPIHNHDQSTTTTTVQDDTIHKEDFFKMLAGRLSHSSRESDYHEEDASTE